jgi:hypothetical protein
LPPVAGGPGGDFGVLSWANAGEAARAKVKSEAETTAFTDDMQEPLRWDRPAIGPALHATGTVNCDARSMRARQ